MLWEHEVAGSIPATPTTHLAPPARMKNEMATSIRHTTEADIPSLPAVERSAARAFGVIPELAWIVDDVVLDEQQHREYMTAGWSWVALANDEPVGFLCAEPIGDEVHVWEVAVSADHQGQGIGTELMAVVERHARDGGAEALTLTTFSDVPWNGPFYAKLGFDVVEPDTDPRLRRVLEQEVAAGQQLERRCAMRRRLSR